MNSSLTRCAVRIATVVALLSQCVLFCACIPKQRNYPPAIPAACERVGSAETVGITRLTTPKRYRLKKICVEAIAVPPPPFQNGDELKATQDLLAAIENKEGTTLADWFSSVAGLFDGTPYDSGALAAEDARFLFDELMQSLDVPPKDDSYIEISSTEHESNVVATEPESSVALTWNLTVNSTKYTVRALFHVYVEVIQTKATDHE